MAHERGICVSTRRGVSAFLIGGATLAGPLAVLPAMASKVVDVPDAELIALGISLEAAWNNERAVLAVLKIEGWDEARFDAAVAATARIVDRIERATATTLGGLKIKSQALAWTHNGEDDFTAEWLADRPDPTTDNRLIAAILRDLHTIV